jgi:superfamily II DNA/RNA helicase
MDQGHKDLVATQIAARKGRTIFFVRTKHGADKLAEKMLRSGVPVGVLHGGKSQGQRTRVLAAFKDGRASALVATDVAARGIHVDDVSLVVHVDAPADHKDYLHRAGRTARAGATGVVVTLATHKQKRGIFGITNQAKVKLNEVYVRPSDPELVRVTGSQEPSGIPVIVEAEKPGRNDRGSRDRGDRGGFRRGHASNFKKRSEGGGRVGDSEKEKPVRSFRGAAPAKPKYEDRPARPERAERPERPNREERPARTFRADRHPKAERFEKSDRPAKVDRFNAPKSSSKPSGKPSKFEKSDRPVKKSYKSDSRPATSTWRADTEKVERSERPERSEKYEGKRPPFKKASGPKKFAKKAPAKRAPLPKGTFKKAGPNKNAGKPKPRVK